MKTNYIKSLENSVSSVTTLYRKNSIGISEWSIWSRDNTIIVAHSTVLGGSKVVHEEVVHEGKQSRTLEQQVQHRINSRISKQRDKGYCDSIETASNQLLNQLGLDVPMLAQTYYDQHVVGAFIQRKLNGLRCLATKQDGEIILYSRRGKRFDHLYEIAESLKHLLNEGDTFDGELYCHGQSLQTIQSWIKRRQSQTESIKYVVYDMIEDEGFQLRYSWLQSAFKQCRDRGHALENVILLAVKQIDCKTKLYESMKKSIDAGFEGLMIRLPDYKYENGKRSKSLLKLKEVFSNEAICTNIDLSAKGNPVCTLSWNGQTFRASPPGSQSDRLNAYNSKEKYIGQRLTFEYRELTDDGIPFHATAVCWRDD